MLAADGISITSLDNFTVCFDALDAAVFFLRLTLQAWVILQSLEVKYWRPSCYQKLYIMEISIRSAL